MSLVGTFKNIRLSIATNNPLFLYHGLMIIFLREKFTLKSFLKSIIKWLNQSNLKVNKEKKHLCLFKKWHSKSKHKATKCVGGVKQWDKCVGSIFWCKTQLVLTKVINMQWNHNTKMNIRLKKI